MSVSFVAPAAASSAAAAAIPSRRVTFEEANPAGLYLVTQMLEFNSLDKYLEFARTRFLSCRGGGVSLHIIQSMEPIDAIYLISDEPSNEHISNLYQALGWEKTFTPHMALYMGPRFQKFTETQKMLQLVEYFLEHHDLPWTNEQKENLLTTLREQIQLDELEGIEEEEFEAMRLVKAARQAIAESEKKLEETHKFLDRFRKAHGEGRDPDREEIRNRMRFISDRFGAIVQQHEARVTSMIDQMAQLGVGRAGEVQAEYDRLTPPGRDRGVSTDSTQTVRGSPPVEG